jgi:hypothetical protein
MTLCPILVAPYRACFLNAVAGKMPCAIGACRYKNDLLIDIILEILLNGEYGWQAVSFASIMSSQRRIFHITSMT